MFARNSEVQLMPWLFEKLRQAGVNRSAQVLLYSNKSETKRTNFINRILCQALKMLAFRPQSLKLSISGELLGSILPKCKPEPEMMTRSRNWSGCVIARTALLMPQSTMTGICMGRRRYHDSGLCGHWRLDCDGSDQGSISQAGRLLLSRTL